MRHKAHLVSAICFLLAAFIFLNLGFKAPTAHRYINFMVGGLFLLNAVVQIFLYRKMRPA